MNDLLEQFRSEWVHVALTTVFGGLVSAFGGLYHLLRRDIQRRDERLAKIEDDLKSAFATLTTHREWYRDIRRAVWSCEAAAHIEHYPFTD